MRNGLDVSVLKDEFYVCIIDVLKKFVLSTDNKEVYALAFDCDSDVGVISLRYRKKKMRKLSKSKANEND